MSVVTLFKSRAVATTQDSGEPRLEPGVGAATTKRRDYKLLKTYRKHLRALARPEDRSLARISRAANFMRSHGLGAVRVTHEAEGLRVVFRPAAQGRALFETFGPDGKRKKTKAR